jgi:hypothetical protein
MHEKIDVAINVFSKPYQTARSVLSLLRFSGQHIEKIYMQFDGPNPSERLSVQPLVEYLGDRAVAFTPKLFLYCNIPNPELFANDEIRHSLRYQYAFEHSDKTHLLVIHNDILVKRDIAGFLREHVGDAIAVGHIGQCWNCPASHQDVMHAAGLDIPACSSDSYERFRPDGKTLLALYRKAEEMGKHIRGYHDFLAADSLYAENGTPPPECRVNEWCCLVNRTMSNQVTVPAGDIVPFGAFTCLGDWLLDTSVTWFRDVIRRGYRARHVDLYGHILHYWGHVKNSGKIYRDAEYDARLTLEKFFPDFVVWCKKHKTGWFP